MKKNYLLLSFGVIALGLTAFNYKHGAVLEDYQVSHLQSGGGQTNLTGAPGEANCTQCHVGSALDGTATTTLTVADGLTPVTSYVPGQTYNVALQLSNAAAKNGFSATALTSVGATAAGTFAGNSSFGGTQDFTGGGRNYVSHNLAGTTSNGTNSAPWLWTWTAPATDVGDVIFYVAANVTNSNNGSTGDMIYLSSYLITPNSSAGLTEVEKDEFSMEAGYSVENHAVIVDVLSLTSESIQMNIVDMNGRVVLSKDLGNAIIGDNHNEVRLPSTIGNGMYVVHYLVGNKAMSKNILVQQ